MLSAQNMTAGERCRHVNKEPVGIGSSEGEQCSHQSRLRSSALTHEASIQCQTCDDSLDYLPEVCDLAFLRPWNPSFGSIRRKPALFPVRQSDPTP